MTRSGATTTAGGLVHAALSVAGPRGLQREAAICEAALQLLVEVGYDRMSMDAVAARAKASKATIYRRWPGKRELVLDAVRLRGPSRLVPPDTGSLRGDIMATLQLVAEGIGAEDAELLAGVLRAARSTPELADCMRTSLVEDKRCIGDAIVSRAIARGELSPTTDAGVLHEIAPALTFFRVMVTGDPVDADYLVHVTDDVLVPLLVHSGQPRPEKETS